MRRMSSHFDLELFELFVANVDETREIRLQNQDEAPDEASRVDSLNYLSIRR